MLHNLLQFTYLKKTSETFGDPFCGLRFGRGATLSGCEPVPWSAPSAKTFFSNVVGSASTPKIPPSGID
jgi:hypothetical protein